MSDPVANWRPIRQGEDIYEWSRTVDGPMRRENIVRHCLSLETNAQRGAFLTRFKQVHGQALYDSVRQEVWRRLQDGQQSVTIESRTHSASP